MLTQFHVQYGEVYHSNLLDIKNSFNTKAIFKKLSYAVDNEQQYALKLRNRATVFGRTKQSGGFRKFLLRGLDKMSGEWKLTCAGQNLLKLFRAH